MINLPFMNVVIMHEQLENTAIPKLVFVRLMDLDFNYFSLLKILNLVPMK